VKRETLIELARGCIDVESAPCGELYIDHEGLDITGMVAALVDRAVEYALQQAAERIVRHATVEPLVLIYTSLSMNPREKDARTHAAVVLATKEHI
jgi:hypothetical protein